MGLVNMFIEPMQIATVNATERPVNLAHNWPVLSLGLFSLFGIFGNLLVCLTIRRDPSLQTKTNFYLFSLAIADLAVCVIVLPLSIVQDYADKWMFSSLVCTLWIFSDILLCTSSIYHLSTVSILRFIAIQFPLKSNQSTSTQLTGLVIFMIWSASILVSSVIIYLGINDTHNVIDSHTSRCVLRNANFIIYGSIFSFVIPLFIMILMFTLMVRKLRMQLKKLKSVPDILSYSRRTADDRRAAKRSSSRQEHSNEPANFRRSVGRQLKHEDLDAHVNQRCRPVTGSQEGGKVRRWTFATRGSSTPSTNSGHNQHHTVAGESFAAQRASSNNYLLVYQNGELRSKSLSAHISQTEVKNEVKALQVLGIVFIAFIIAWLPFCLVNMLAAISEMNSMSIHVKFQRYLIYLTYLGYLQSTFNPIIYTIFNKKFRRNFLEIIRCKKRRELLRSRKWAAHTFK
nr:G protein-coupled receptor [Proales similis]